MQPHRHLAAVTCLAVAFSLATARAAPPPAPTTVPTGDAFARRIHDQLHATRPDFVAFVPDPADDTIRQTGNEHFLVFDGPDGSLMTVWTQSTGEGQPDQHIVFSRSTDDGKTWDRPRRIAGPALPGQGAIASWAFPLISRSGRVYVLYSQHVGKFDTFFHTTGRLDGIVSDDNGRTWSSPETVPLPRSARDNPDVSYPPNIICWQRPQRLGEGGRYFAGVTRWTSKAVRKNPGKSWTSHDSVTEFLQFDNVDDNPPVHDLRVSFPAGDASPLTVPHPQFPQVSVCQEPSLVKLPDGRLFCVMRTFTGHPYWSASADQGHTWTTPRVLLDGDNGRPLLHPLSPCPIYDIGGSAAASGRYILLIHGNDGHYHNSSPEQTGDNRRPILLAAGRYHAGADQPVWFDAPRLLMDHDGTALGAPGSKGRTDLAMYDSFTVYHGTPVLWYPDRKFFLLGRVIDDHWFTPKP